MQKWMSPARIFGRKNRFCSSLPKRMIVGATLLIVSIGTGAPAAHRLVEEHELLDRRPTLSAVLLGPADTGPSVGAHLLPHRAHRPADPRECASSATVSGSRSFP